MSTIKRNDGPTTIPFQLQRDNVAMNINGATVRAIIARKSKRDLLVSIPCNITDGQSGSGEFILPVSQASQATDYVIELEVTFQDGEVRTFPSAGYIPLTILPDLG
jgi:hypothetical protein